MNSENENKQLEGTPAPANAEYYQEQQEKEIQEVMR